MGASNSLRSDIMDVRSGVLGLVGFALIGSMAGCVITPSTSTGNPYVKCSTSASCDSLTTCQAASTSMTGSSTYFCTTSCSVGADCPADIHGTRGVCVSVSGFGNQCYQACATTADCPGNESCGMVGTSTFCVPG